MKFSNFWRTLFVSMMAVSAFVACSDDDDEGYSGIPEVTVNGASEVTLYRDLTEGATEAVSIVSNASWTLKFEAESASTWCTPSAWQGGAGTTALSFTCSALESGEREAVAVVTAMGQVMGVPVPSVAKIKIHQTGAGETVVIYNETFGTAQVAANTFVDQYTDWNKSGTGAADVTYVGSNASIRNSSPNSTTSYEGASGAPILFFGKAPATFTVQNIALTSSETKLKLTFGGQQTINYDTKDYTWSNANLLVALSADGQTWTDITYTTNDGDKTNPNWVLATSNFTLKEAVSKLYIRFTTANLDSAIRIDDITLTVGEGGTVVDLGEGGGETPQPGETVKIGEIKTAGNYKTTGTVVARGKMAYIIADETGAMMVYHKDNTRVVGEKIAIEGAVTVFNATSTPQFSDAATVTVESTGNTWNYQPTVLDAAGMDALLTATPVCKDVQFEGTLAISGNYANVTIAGAATAIGSIKYIDNATISAFNGKNVVVKGYFVGTSSNKYVNVLPYSVEEAAGETPTEPTITGVNPASLSWSAEETGMKPVTVTGVDLAGNLTAVVDNASFKAVVNGTTVEVTPAGANTTEADITATLTLKAGSSTKTVALKQSKPAGQGGGTEVITVDFTSLPSDFPTAYEKTEKTFNLSGYDFTFIPDTANGYKYDSSNKYFIFGKQNAAIQFPAIAGKKLVKVVCVSRKGASGNVQCAIADAAGTAIAGGEAIKWAQTEPYTYTYNLTGSEAGVAYRLLITSKYNAQLTSLELTFE